MDKNNRWVLLGIAIILVMFILFLALLWKIGLFDFSGTESSAKIVAATIALVAGLFGSLVSLFGILLKQSFDHRTLNLKIQEENRLKLESERNNNLRIEGEKRLKLEAAIQAVQLLSTSSGAEVPMTQRAGVLFSLAHLDLIDLALTMLNQMLANDRIDAETTSWLLDKAINSNNESTQINASVLLEIHVERLLLDEGRACFPDSVVDNWDTNLPVDVRDNIAVALLKLVSSRHQKDWDVGVLNTIIATLISIWRTETETRISLAVAVCLEKIVQNITPGHIIYYSTGDVLIDDVKQKLTELLKDNDPGKLSHRYVLSAKILAEDWLGKATDRSTEPDDN